MFYMRQGGLMRRVVIWWVSLLSFLVLPLTMAATGTLSIPGPLSSGWQQGFDFRHTAGFVTDPPGDTYVLSTTAYPTKGGGTTYGWAKTSLVQGRDRNAGLDPRLAGINFVNNGAPATFNVDLPSPG